MRHLKLTEYRMTPAVPLSAAERDVLSGIVTAVPTLGLDGHYDLTPGATVGAIEVGSVSVELRPKLPIDRVLFLVSYALDPSQWRETGFDFGEAESLPEAMVPGFVRQVRSALRRGPLQGYRPEEHALTTVRGRIRIADQVRARHGIAPPIEVAFDEFTEDFTENRLLKAAIRRLGRMRIRSQDARRMLRSFDELLATVTDIEFDPRRLPEIRWTRLNEHYRPAVRLSELILRSSSIELGPGGTRSSAFVLNMNQVFEDFVVVALREALGLDGRSFPQNDGRLGLDVAGGVRLEPDLSWWEHGRCSFVGDVKYKRVNAAGIKHPDLYQLLAYVVASALPGGLLVYAAGEGEPAVHEVVYLGRRLEVVSLALDGSPGEVLGQVGEVAGRVRRLRRAGRLPGERTA